MAATPASFMEQQRHPFANSRSSCDFSAVGSSAVDILMAFARRNVSEGLQAVRRVMKTFDALPITVQ
jgi:hypothetical protein